MTNEEKRFSNVWKGIRKRIYDKNRKEYQWYGGRGINCLWKNFSEFKSDMFSLFLEHAKVYGIKNTFIERKDNDGHYCKDNCCFTTMKKQCRNRRSNRFITFNGVTKTIMDWELSLGFKGKGRLQNRIDRYKWPIEKALTTPCDFKKKMVAFDGKYLSINGWAKELNINLKTLQKRLRKWTVERALTEPIRLR